MDKYLPVLAWGRTQKNLLYMLLGSVLTGKVLSPEVSFADVDYIILGFGVGFLLFEFVLQIRFIINYVKGKQEVVREGK